MIKIYTTATCPYCEMAKEFFKERNLAYQECDVSSDENAQKEMIDKSRQMAVPVIDVDGKIIIGFNREEIEKAIKQSE